MLEFEKVIHKAFIDFYDDLQSNEYLKQFFVGVDIKELIKKLEDNFLQTMHMDPKQIEGKFIDLGHMHYRLGLPYSRYIKSFQTLLKNIILNLPDGLEATKELAKVQHVIEHAITGTAKGYLEEMISYDLDIISQLLQDSIAQKFVTEHLVWIERVCMDIKTHTSKPSVELDQTKCLLGEWLQAPQTRHQLSQKELKRIDAMHHKVHAMAKSVYDSLQKQDFHALLIDYSFLVRHSHHINYELNQIITQKDLLSKIELDPLTGLSNRKSMNDMIQKRELDCDKSFCIAMCDLDNFKHINDTYGHLCGDLVLRKVSQLLKEHLRKDDKIYRYGGEEFLIIFDNTTVSQVHQHLESIRQEVEKSVFFYNSIKIKVTISIGLSEYDCNLHKSFEQLIQKADKSLYQAKKSGRNKVIVI